jgi:flagellum-specific peptidoglycan hydrolase FlgJ
VVSKGKPNTAPTTTQKKVTPRINKSLQKPAEKKPATTKPASTIKPTVVTKPPTAKLTAKPTPAKTQTKAKASPKPTGSVLQRELAGANTFINKFQGKKGMERAVAKMQERKLRLQEDLKLYESIV